MSQNQVDNFLSCPEYRREQAFASQKRRKGQNRAVHCTLSQCCREAMKRISFVPLCTLFFLISSSLEKILLSTFNFPFSTLVPFFILTFHSPLKQIQMKEKERKCEKMASVMF